MQLPARICVGCALLGCLVGATNPVSKVIQLLTELETKLTKDGEAEDKAYAAYADFCGSSAQDKGFEIKTAKAEIEDAKATIGKAVADISASDTKIEELSGTISGNDADLKAATGIREKERAEFVAAEAELVETVSTLDRAINVLEKKLKGSALMQAKVSTKDLGMLVKTLSAVIDAAGVGLHDKKKLMGLVQANSGNDDDDDEAGAPAAEAYQSHSRSIIDVLEDLREKAETQLSEARKEESNAQHNYNMLKQSLEDQIAADNKEFGEAKSTKYTANEVKATSEGDLAVTQKDLADAENALAELNGGCQTAAADHEASVKSRQEELKALADARKAITENAKGAENQVYNSASFLQVENSNGGEAEISTQSDLANFEVVSLIRKLAKQYKSSTLLQLAGRIQAVMKYGSENGEDPFAKVKALITDLIAKLEQEAGQEASHKAYCDKEMAGTKEKLDDLNSNIDSLSAKIDKKAALSAKLKGEVQELQAELAELAKSQATMDEVRREEQKVFITKKSDLEQGLDGVRTALKVLREYYANDDGAAAAAAALMQQPAAPEYHEKASGSGTGIIGMLEVIESDFGKSLAQATTDEDSAEMEYQKTTQINKVTRATKDQDVKYKTKEAAGLNKEVTELTSDRTSSQSELDAVLEYKRTIINTCVAKPETYEERKARREAEISGLKEALQILNGEAVLIQKSKNGLRGSSIKLHF
jgi:chromosome segregation ATPase